MNLNKVLNVSKKEILSYLDNPSSYVVLFVFHFIWQFLFFRNVFLVGETSLKALFEIMPWFMLVLIPAITMGSFSKEKEDGTLELLFTHPIKEIEIIAGKFISSLLFIVFALLLTLPIAFSLNLFGSLDWGVYFSQIIGGILFSSALIALGIFISSLFSGQIVSLLLTIFAGFLLSISGTELITISLSGPLVNIFERLSLLTHFDSISKGSIDLRDVWYFVSFTLLFLGLTYLQSLKMKYGVNKIKYISYQTAIILFTGIMILSNIVGDRIPGRIDLTKNQVYTLSQTTTKTLSGLDDIVKMTLYSSGQLPAQYAPVVRETKDLLRDYKTESKGNLEFEIKDPSADADVEKEAQADGVQQIQFNVIGQEEFQLKNGYLGLVISYGGAKEVIPFIQDVSDLEYQLTSLIKKLTNPNKQTVGFLAGHGEHSINYDLRYLNQELSKLYNVVEITPDEETKAITQPFSTLVIVGPTEAYDGETLASIESALTNGKNVLFMLDRNLIDSQNMTISLNPNNLFDLISEYGVEVKQNMIYDLGANLTVRAGDGVANYLLPYPLWIRSFTVTSNLPITNKLSNVDIPWGSSVITNSDILSQNGYSAVSLLSTSEYGGEIEKTYSLDPSQTFASENLGKRDMAVALDLVQQSPQSSKGKMIVIGDSDIASDQFVQQSPQNLSFVMNSVSWLTEGDVFADIKSKDRFGGTLVFQSEDQPTSIRFINLAIAAVLPLLIGATRYLRRSKLKNKVYAR